MARLKTTPTSVNPPVLSPNRIRVQTANALLRERNMWLSPAVMDKLIKEADAETPGDLPAFTYQLGAALDAYKERNPSCVVRDAPKRQDYPDPTDDLKFWFPRNERGELVNAAPEMQQLLWDWLNDPKVTYLDTETTGTQYFDQPFSLAVCRHDETPVISIKFRPTDRAGKTIPIAEDASKVNGVVTSQIEHLDPIESHIKALESLVNDGLVFCGYNTSFDRGMLVTALQAAVERNRKDTALRTRLEACAGYFADVTHWHETKEPLVLAGGYGGFEMENGKRTGVGWKIKLTHITEALKLDAQDHTALGDVVLLARCVKALAKQTPQPTTEPPEPSGRKPEETAAQPDAPKRQPEPEQAKPTEQPPRAELNLTRTDELMAQVKAARDYAAELEQKSAAQTAELSNLHAALHKETIAKLELQAQVDDLARQVREAQTMESNGMHQEARTIAWTNIIVNKHQINVTSREGSTPEEVAQAVLTLDAALRLIYQDDRVREYASIIENKTIIALKSPTTKKPVTTQDDDSLAEDGSETGYDPSQDKPAQTKNPPPASKPAGNGNGSSQPTTPNAEGIDGTEPIGFVTKVRNEDDSIGYQLWGKNEKLQWPIWKIGRLESEVTMIEMALEEHGISPTTMKFAEKRSVDLKVDWRNSKKMDSKGKPYKNIAAIR